jgi:diacylglycerol kinase (ATP)
MVGDKGNVSAAYLRATLKAFVSYRPVSCRVTIDGEPWFSGPLYLLAITKGSHFGQGMYISPRAVLDNGLAEISAVMPMARWQLPLRLGRLYLGNHLGTSYVHYRRGRSIQLEPGAGCNSFETDGEISAASPVRIDTLPAALSLLA